MDDTYRIELCKPEAAGQSGWVTLDGWHHVDAVWDSNAGWGYAVATPDRDPYEYEDKEEAEDVAQLLSKATGKPARVVPTPSPPPPWTQLPLADL
jgi:hypothetical protein